VTIKSSEVYKTLDEVPIRIGKLGEHERGAYCSSPDQITLDPRHVETAYELAVTLLHEVVHHVRPKWSETHVERAATRLMYNTKIALRAYAETTEAMMFALGGGRRPLAKADAEGYEE
jgi:hypothetical protein